MILCLLFRNCATGLEIMCLPCGKQSDPLVKLGLYRACDILIGLLSFLLSFAKSSFHGTFTTLGPIKPSALHLFIRGCAF